MRVQSYGCFSYVVKMTLCLAGLIKVCLSFENGLLPANLHYSEPNPKSEGLIDGTLKVVTEPTEFKKGIVALSNFGFGGVKLYSTPPAKFP